MGVSSRRLCGEAFTAAESMSNEQLNAARLEAALIFRHVSIATYPRLFPFMLLK